MTSIAIIVAMQSEFELVRTLLEKPVEVDLDILSALIGNIGDKRVALIKSGIGKVNAAITTTNVINQLQPDYIINTGVAGGLVSSVKQGDVVIAERVSYHDVWCGEGAIGQVQGLPLYFHADEQLLEATKQISGLRTHIGHICSGDQFVSQGSDFERIQANFPEALAVDMESAPIAHVCHIYDTPFISLRVISDSPSDNEDNTNQYFDFMKDAPQRTFEAIRQICQMKL